MIRKILDHEGKRLKQHEKDGISIGMPVENPDNVKLKYAIMKDQMKEVISLRESFDF